MCHVKPVATKAFLLNFASTVCVYVYVYVCTCVYVCMYVCVCVCVEKK